MRLNKNEMLFNQMICFYYSYKSSEYYLNHLLKNNKILKKQKNKAKTKLKILSSPFIL